MAATSTGWALRNRTAAATRSTTAIGPCNSRMVAARVARCPAMFAINRSLRRASSMSSSMDYLGEAVAVFSELCECGCKELGVRSCGAACAQGEDSADYEIRGRKQPRSQHAVGVPGNDDDEQGEKNDAACQEKTEGSGQ